MDPPPPPPPPPPPQMPAASLNRFRLWVVTAWPLGLGPDEGFVQLTWHKGVGSARGNAYNAYLHFVSKIQKKRASQARDEGKGWRPYLH
ncbi:uncharacterized protein E0L32_010071 [Thyridium curvatum]|uniref:Uncharacterized protein n=1 Tax=Thyridium curvatum TaxID=1093900 RepID=A0A507APN5_9PEZI|nr:uncharacterized protein E0L32_010071 [Thyridium curvatum]TPX08454.1 hypothetical protein E0L32_010071 [Thyridium curvatum]